MAYIIKRKYEYVYSTHNKFGLISPKWTICENEALKFKNKSLAQMIADTIGDSEVISESDVVEKVEQVRKTWNNLKKFQN